MLSRHFTNDSEHLFDFLRRVDDAARHTRIRHAIRSVGSDYALSEKTIYYFLLFHTFHVEADHAGGKIFIARRVELDTRHASKSLFHLRVELVRPRGDSRRSDVLMETNRFR